VDQRTSFRFLYTAVQQRYSYLGALEIELDDDQVDRMNSAA